MSITVRLIFMGLIGFAPDPQGQTMTALFVDPAQVRPEDACAHKHLPVVYLIEGECSGNHCQPAESSPEARLLVAGKELDGKPLPLAWRLEKEEMELLHDEDEKVRLSQGRAKTRLLSLPKHFWQRKYFSWVPSMGTLTGGSGEIREDCLDGAETCPIEARVTVRGGRASACHLFHSSSVDERGKAQVELFEYRIQEDPSPRPIQRAVADAVEVKLNIEGDSIDLRSWGFRTPEDRQMKVKRAARLTPDKEGRITLILANMPVPSSTPMQGHQCSEFHSEVLFDLLAKAPIAKFTRTSMTGKQLMKPGSCEDEVVKLGQLITSSRFHPRVGPTIPSHSTTACDGGSFP